MSQGTETSHHPVMLKSWEHFVAHTTQVYALMLAEASVPGPTVYMQSHTVHNPSYPIAMVAGSCINYNFSCLREVFTSSLPSFPY